MIESSFSFKNEVKRDQTKQKIEPRRIKDIKAKNSHEIDHYAVP